MQQQEHFRHELKYEIGYAEYLSVRSRLRAIMKSDCHTGEDGVYHVHSVYFDNYQDKNLVEKVNGYPYREKFRIRYYNDDLSFITLEKKIKQNNLCRKISASITKEEYEDLMRGRTDWMRNHPEALVRELYAKMKYQALRPRVLVSYKREPYVYAAGNVRITFDSHIRSSLYENDFTSLGSRGIPATDTTGTMVLEVKYDGFIPDIIRKSIQCGTLRQEAFSKYGICRRFG